MEYRICSRCVMDTSDPEITFNEKGECNHCSNAFEELKHPPYSLDSAGKKAALEGMVATIKAKGKGRRYDCIIGLSGGVDSSYLAYLVKRVLGLRPLAVHLDNGWNSEISMGNIESICKCLEIDLYTHVIDWEEFKDLQLSFLKASTPDSEIPSDHAIVSLLYEIAAREGVKFIIGGTNFETESILPQAWSRGHFDWKYIRSVQSIFGSKKLRTFPHRSFFKHAWFKLMNRIQWLSFLDFVDYSKDDAKVIIAKELGWRDYGRKHGESNYTRVFQEYILPVKFGYDKRRAHYSSLIVSGRMTREEALRELAKPLYESEEKKREDIRYLCSKFGIDSGKFEEIMSAPKKTIMDYPSYARSRMMNSLLRAIKSAKSK